MKLFIQIPCLNEERTLPHVIAGLPTSIPHIDEIRLLIVDDGSTDKTVETAKKLGVDYIVSNGKTLGLAKSFSKGLDACLSLGADIIVNTDGDNQYAGADIAKLVNPIVEGKSDIVIGCRDIVGHSEFSWLKKFLQRWGSKVVRSMSGINIPDATSGFRGINRTAAIKFSIMSNFSYTIEMLVQAVRIGLKVSWIPVRTNAKLRESRLFKSNTSFVINQLTTIVKTYVFYSPIRFFGWLSLISFAASTLLSLRIFYFLWFFEDDFKFKTGSGVLLLFFSITTVLFFVAGTLGAVLSGLRNLIIDLRSRFRNFELQQNIDLFEIDIFTTSKFSKWADYGKDKKSRSVEQD